MKNNVYDQLNTHTALMSASAILFDGQMVAKIIFKFPKDGAGRLYVYAHWLGVPMVRSSASGYGYDKKSAALSRLPTIETDTYSGAAQLKFIEALAKCDDGHGWEYHLRQAGFIICTII